MSDDRLKKFIQQHKADFEQVEKPDLNRLWSDFNKGQKTKVIHWQFWSIAASVAILLTVSAGLIGYYLGGTSQPTLAQILAEDDQTAEQYATLIKEISLREEQIVAKNIQKEEYVELFQAIDELDDIQKLYEADLASHTNERALIKSLLRQYEKKSRLLELLLFEFEKKSKNEDRDHFTRL